MRRLWKRTLAAAAITAVALVTVRVVAFVWAGGALESYASSHAGEVELRKKELAAIRLPSLHGPAKDVICTEKQARFFGSNALGDPKFSLFNSLDDWPATRISSDARSFVAAHADDLAGLRATLDCSRTQDDRSFWELRAGHAAYALVLDGEAHAEDGDIDGAMDREIDGIRVGIELGAIAAANPVANGALALARTVARSTGSAAIDKADAALTSLAPFAPSPSAYLVDAKLLLVDVARDPNPSDDDAVGSLDAPRYEPLTTRSRTKMRAMKALLPTRAIVALAISDLDAQFDQAIDAANSGDADRLRQTQDALMADNERTMNPIVWRISVPGLMSPVNTVKRAACGLAVARAVVILERARSADGHYPASSPMPPDPCAAGAPIHFESLADSAGYRVWSVGANGHDDHGIGKTLAYEGDPDDLMAQREPSPPP